MEIINENHIISLITNFGCHRLCPYCIIKNTGMKIKKTTIQDIPLLKQKIIESGNGLISISGGGDPLHEYEKNKYFYNKLFSMLAEVGCKAELHTSYISSSFPYAVCYRVVYHIIGKTDIYEIKCIKRQLTEKTRIVFVIEDNYTIEDINNIYNEYIKNKDIDELSFRQLVNPDYTVSYHLDEFLQKGHEQKKWYYIKQGDYNEYFANGKIKNIFKEIR